MYKVFINRTEVHFFSEEEFLNVQKADFDQVLTHIPDVENVEHFFHSQVDKKVAISTPKNDGFRAFLNAFLKVDAGGGIVRNPKHEILAIFRHGVWDLPKGKLEKNESFADGAKREVEEETGVQIDRVNEKKGISTYHMYPHKGQMVLKETQWFEMESGSERLQPQEEEGIEKVIWLSQDDFRSNFLKNSYASIRSLFPNL